MTGKLYGIGVGPGDPELVTVKAARLIEAADVVAYFSGTHGNSLARRIAAPYVPDTAVEELFRYPVTTQVCDTYFDTMDAFYDESAHKLQGHLDAGRDVVVLAEGDPLFYGTFMYLYDRLATDYDCEIVPGVTSNAGATAAAALPLCRHEDTVTILPGTLPEAELAWRLAECDAAIIMKLGRTFGQVREALTAAGRLDEAVLVERATWPEQRVLPVADVDAADVAYMSVIVVPGRDRRADSAGRAATALPAVGAPEASAIGGKVWVVGLGPGPDKWLTPETEEVLSRVQAVYGYAPYVRRIPPRPGLELMPSGNTVEIDRAREALAAAASGREVAVVSGGDPGIFAMASTVFEAARAPEFAEVEVVVVPGVTAASAVAAKAGAPLGGDFALVSLSDRLKPWEVVERRLRLLARADVAIGIYNPRSKARPSQLFEARDILLQEKPEATIVVIGRDIGRAEESLMVTTLGEFDPETVDMKCLVIIGSSATQAITQSGETRVWTPRYIAADGHSVAQADGG